MDILFSILMIIAISGVLLNEFYAHKLKVSAMPTLPWTRGTILDLIEEYKPREDMVVYELGSGWGGMAKRIARRFPAAQVLGVELSPFPYLISKLNLRRNLRFKRANVLDIDLADADILALYLTPNILGQLKPKFEAELKAGSVIIACGFEVPGWSAIKKAPMKGALEKEIFVYRV